MQYLRAAIQGLLERIEIVSVKSVQLMCDDSLRAGLPEDGSPWRGLFGVQLASMMYAGIVLAADYEAALPMRQSKK